MLWFTLLLFCEIIYIGWTFNFASFVGWTINEFKIPPKYLFTLIILHIISNPQIQVFTNISISVKPTNLKDFTVLLKEICLRHVKCTLEAINPG